MKELDTHALMKEIGGITASIQGMDKKLTEYCIDNKTQHTAMWRKMDGHSKKINWFMGGVAVISSALTYAFIAFKHKIIGGQ